MNFRISFHPFFFTLMTVCTQAPQVCARPDDSCYPSMTWQFSSEVPPIDVSGRKVEALRFVWAYFPAAVWILLSQRSNRRVEHVCKEWSGASAWSGWSQFCAGVQFQRCAYTLLWPNLDSLACRTFFQSFTTKSIDHLSRRFATCSQRRAKTAFFEQHLLWLVGYLLSKFYICDEVVSLSRGTEPDALIICCCAHFGWARSFFWHNWSSFCREISCTDS